MRSLALRGPGLIAALSVSLSVPAATTSPAAATPSCGGQPATVIGTDGDDTLEGGYGDDVIWAGSGNDIISGGGAGNDIICGGLGNDRIYAGAGDDIISGGAGNDIIHGGLGNDRIYAGAGDDEILPDPSWYGGSETPGDDTVRGGRGADTVFISGADGLYDNPATQLVVRVNLAARSATGAGNDFLGSVELLELYTRGAARVRTDQYTQWVNSHAAAGTTVVTGRRGMTDGAHQSYPGTLQVQGGDADDHFTINHPGVVVLPVLGQDIVDVNTDSGSVWIEAHDGLEVNGGPGSEHVTIHPQDAWGSYEIRTGGGHDVLAVHGDIGPSPHLNLGSGPDLVIQLPDRGTVLMGSGNDTLHGQRQQTRAVVRGGRGRDKVRGTSGADVINQNLGKRLAAGVLTARFHSFETAVGFAGADRLVGDARRGLLSGGPGNDLLYGLGGRDVLRGAAGDDVLRGGAGDDVAVGGEDYDVCRAETRYSCERR